MKKRITAIITGPSRFDLVIDGAQHPITAHREILWKQGITMVPESAGGRSEIVSHDPSDENAFVEERPNCIFNLELAKLHEDWAAGRIPDGEHKVQIDFP